MSQLLIHDYLGQLDLTKKISCSQRETIVREAFKYLLKAWVPQHDQHKEEKSKDPTIREQFDTYRFADHKETVIDLLKRSTAVSVETGRITEAMKGVVR